MNVCCQEMEELQERLFADDLVCIKQHREFPMVVLEEAVLRTALVAMKDVKKTSFREPIAERSVLRFYGLIFWHTSCQFELGRSDIDSDSTAAT